MDLLKRQKEITEQIAQVSRDYAGLQGQLQKTTNELQEQLNKTATELVKLQGCLEENQRQIAEEEKLRDKKEATH